MKGTPYSIRNNEFYGDMAAWQNKTVTEIAQELGVNKSTVSRTLLRAKRRLYQCLRYAL